MELTVLLFAQAAESSGDRSLKILLPVGSSVAELRKALPRCPPNWAIAVNREYAVDSKILEEIDEIAVIPPVSGG